MEVGSDFAPAVPVLFMDASSDIGFMLFSIACKKPAKHFKKTVACSCGTTNIKCVVGAIPATQHERCRLAEVNAYYSF